MPRVVLRGFVGWRGMRKAGFWDMPLQPNSGMVWPVPGERTDTTPARFVSEVDL